MRPPSQNPDAMTTTGLADVLIAAADHRWRRLVTVPSIQSSRSAGAGSMISTACSQAPITLRKAFDPATATGPAARCTLTAVGLKRTPLLFATDAR